MFYRPFGIGFTEDKIELSNGFKRYDQDIITKKRQLNYKGTFTDYMTCTEKMILFFKAHAKSDKIFYKKIAFLFFISLTCLACAKEQKQIATQTNDIAFQQEADSE